MVEFLGTTWTVYLLITVIIIGFAAYMTGQALAKTWRPVWQVFVYCILLGFADRFLVFALFEGQLLSISGYLFDTLTLTVMAFFSYRYSMTRTMADQYPWLYERVGFFALRKK